MTTEVEVPVFLAGWEIECCELPPGQGDHVRWPLLWLPTESGPGLLNVPWQVTRPLPRGQDADRAGLQLRSGPLNSWWRGTASQDVPTRGCLVADMHGGVPEELPPTHGTVHRVEVVSQAYRLTAPRTYFPIDEDYELCAVSRSPAHFSDARNPYPLPDVWREDSGVLVLLTVDETAV